MKTSKKLTDTFCQTIEKNFKSYCFAQKQQKDISALITYLLDREIISPVTVRRYTIIQMYTQISNNTDWKKTETVNHLAQRFNISSRSVWNILRKNKVAK